MQQQLRALNILIHINIQSILKNTSKGYSHLKQRHKVTILFQSSGFSLPLSNEWNATIGTEIHSTTTPLD